MAKDTTTDINDVLGEMNAGVFMKQVDEVFKQTALAVADFGDKTKKGKIKLEFEITPLGNDSGMVNIKSSWSFKKPSLRGEATEKNTTDMPFCVNKGGILSVYPLNQADLFEASGNVTPLREQK